MSAPLAVTVEVEKLRKLRGAILTAQAPLVRATPGRDLRELVDDARMEAIKDAERKIEEILGPIREEEF